MWRRHAQILGLLLCILGWIFVGCTFALDHWRMAQVGGQGGSSVVVTAWYWSNLWKDCYEDSTAVVNCVDLGVLWTVKSYIHTVRGLLIIGLCLGLIGLVFTFFGLECTRIGGDQRSNDRMLTAASAVHLLGCTSDMAAYCLYINTVVSAFLHSKADPSKMSYEIGPPLYIGLVGSFLILLGSVVQCGTACRPKHPTRNTVVLYVCDRGEESGVLKRQKHIRESSKMFKDSQSSFHYKMASVVTV
ncbi:uncharacterized protein V6R79_024093 [Siganus canaliculatus]